MIRATPTFRAGHPAGHPRGAHRRASDCPEGTHYASRRTVRTDFRTAPHRRTVCPRFPRDGFRQPPRCKPEKSAKAARRGQVTSPPFTAFIASCRADYCRLAAARRRDFSRWRQLLKPRRNLRFPQRANATNFAVCFTQSCLLRFPASRSIVSVSSRPLGARGNGTIGRKNDTNVGPTTVAVIPHRINQGFVEYADAQR